MFVDYRLEFLGYFNMYIPISRDRIYILLKSIKYDVFMSFKIGNTFS